jgi:hypothetical protein
MVLEKLPLDQYELRYGPLPTILRIEGCTVVRREFPLTNEAEVSIELPDGLPTIVPPVQ